MGQALDLAGGRTSTSRQVTLGGLFLALSVVLGTTGWGLIALPTPAGAATTMHIPVVLAGIVGGPSLGCMTGFAFGLFAWQRFPAFDPLVHLLPRIFIGLAAWGFFRAAAWLLKHTPIRREMHLSIAAACAAVMGTVCNTAGVLTVAVINGYFTPPAAWAIGIAHGIPELFLAVIITVPLTCALSRVSEALWKNDDLLK